jgi:hypothetical protein
VVLYVDVIGVFVFRSRSLFRGLAAVTAGAGSLRVVREAPRSANRAIQSAKEELEPVKEACNPEQET